jgi:hypothetical protein
MTEKVVCLVVLWTIVRYENNIQAKRYPNHFGLRYRFLVSFAKSDKIKKGDKVLLFNARKSSRKGSKMEKSWKGPYEVHDISDMGVATLTQLEDPLHNRIHCYCLSQLMVVLFQKMVFRT